MARKTAEQRAEEKRLKKEKKLQKKEEKRKYKEYLKQQKVEKKKQVEEARKKQLEEDKKLMAYTDADKKKFERIVSKLTKYIGKDQGAYKLRIKKAKNFNATAGLGKKLTVYSALFHMLKTEAGLATIIAHEMGHIERKHVTKGMAVSTLTGAAGIALAVLANNPSATRVASSAAGSANRAYSRSHERSADLFAIDLMNKVYCKSPGKLEGYKIMLEKEKDVHYAEYLRTHPLAQKRYDYMAKMIKDAGCVL